MKKISILLTVLASLFFLGIGYIVMNKGLERNQQTDRTVTMFDTGAHLSSTSKRSYSYTFGYFIDKETSEKFQAPIDIDTYNQFKHNEINHQSIVRSFSIDDIQSTSFGKFLIFFGGFFLVLGFSGLGLAFGDLKDFIKKNKVQNETQKTV